MANLYGVANAPGLPQTSGSIGGGSDVSIPPGANTAFFTTPPIIAPSNGYFYVMFWATLEVLTGATAPNGFAVLSAIGAGTWANQSLISTFSWPVSATINLSMFSATVPSQVAWQGAGSTASMGAIALTNGVTIRSGSAVMWCLFRAPDQ